jgi:hypothetical protein
MKAGIVFYKIENGQLATGKWTHANIGSKIASEEVKKIGGLGITGNYEVNIFLVDCSHYYSGKLTIEEVEATFHLKWKGNFMHTLANATFEGIGLIVGEYLVSSFEETNDFRK